ncbi:MAG: hypothetical protein AAGA06_08765 [Pseudomonadota bacterium]
MRKVLRISVLSGWLSFCLGQHAIACAFHGYTPDPTLIDLLYASDHAVIARLNGDDPSRFVPVSALIGPETSGIPIATSPETRQKLLDAPGRTILLARDGAYGPWVELAVLDDRFRDVIAHALAQQPSWAWGGDAARAQHFAGLVNDPNPTLRRLALQELDRAPYATLRALDRPRVHDLKRELVTVDDDLTPIRILLAGLSGDRDFSAVLQSELDEAIRDNVPYLGAYATALIELDGQPAVESILNRYLISDKLSLETRQKLLQALAIQHKTAPQETRRSIARGVAELMRNTPEIGDSVTRQFGIRNNWVAARPASTDPDGASPDDAF